MVLGGKPTKGHQERFGLSTISAGQLGTIGRVDKSDAHGQIFDNEKVAKGVSTCNADKVGEERHDSYMPNPRYFVTTLLFV